MGIKLSCARGVALQHRQGAPTPCRASAAFDLLRGSSPAMEMPSWCIALLQPEGRLRSPHQPVLPPAPGRVTPDMNLPWRGSSHVGQMSTASLGRIQLKSQAKSSRRGFCSEAAGKPYLDVLTQLDFYEHGDINAAHWNVPVSFMEKYPAVLDASMHNRMIPKDGNRPWMLSGIGRVLWQSAALLVFINKLRGHDIARALFEGNLKVSPSGTFALVVPVSDPYDGSKPFMGYEVLRTLFITLMQKVYGMSVMLLLTLDVQDYMNVLKNPPDDRMVIYHAVFLSSSGRTMLNIRLHSLVRYEVNFEEFQVFRDAIHELLANLPDVSSDPNEEKTDRMHILFFCLRMYGVARKNRDAPEETVPGQDPTKQQADQGPQQELGEAALRKVRVNSGYSVIGINRNAVLHRVLPKVLKKLAKAGKLPGQLKAELSLVKEHYCLWEIVQLQHYHMPMHLPKAQSLAIELGLWRHLEIGSLYPRDEIFHHMTHMRLHPKPDSKTMFTYRSARGIEGPTDSAGDSKNSRIFVGGLDPTVTREDLAGVFGAYGTLIDVKIVTRKGIGFIEYSTRASAECAIQALNGIQLRCGTIRLAYAHRATAMGPLLGGHYAHPQTYDNYAWAMKMYERDKEIRQKQFEAQLANDGGGACFAYAIKTGLHALSRPSKW